MTNNLTNKKLFKEFIIRGIKIIDFFYIIVLYCIISFFMAFIMSLITNSKPYNKEEYKKKKSIVIFSEIVFQLWIVAVLVYIVRNIIKLIPFPLNGVYGFKHLRVKELDSGAIFSTIMAILIWNNSNMTEKVQILFKKFKKDTNNL